MPLSAANPRALRPQEVFEGDMRCLLLGAELLRLATQVLCKPSPEPAPALETTARDHVEETTPGAVDPVVSRMLHLQEVWTKHLPLNEVIDIVAQVRGGLPAAAPSATGSIRVCLLGPAMSCMPLVCQPLLQSPEHASDLKQLARAMADAQGGPLVLNSVAAGAALLQCTYRHALLLPQAAQAEVAVQHDGAISGTDSAPASTSIAQVGNRCSLFLSTALLAPAC